MTAALPYVLLLTTLSVRVLLARKNRLGWFLDLATIPGWCAYYVGHQDWPLLAVPFVFGALDVKALRGAWRR